MEDSFSVRIKIETSNKALKNRLARQTALCGLLLSQGEGDLTVPPSEVKIPERLSELVLQLFELENVGCSYARGKIMFENIESSVIWELSKKLIADIEGSRLSTDDARRFLRGSFWGSGYCSDPKKSYRIEFAVQKERAASLISAALYALSIKHICSERDGSFAVYFKNGDDVSDFLGYIGSITERLEFENIRAGKDINGKVFRTMNCDEANSKRQAEAAASRNELINKVIRSGKVNKLSPELQEAAKAHMENPGASIAELGAMMNPPIGKSGMRHRLDKIAEFAKNL